MKSLAVYNVNGEKTGTVALSPTIFDVTVKPWIIQQVVEVLRRNSRGSVAHTKDRSEVSGGGKKPWRQKGTGRARHGSIRSPLWKGGGITFGPRNTRNFSAKINKKVNRSALCMTLTEKAHEDSIKILDQFTCKNIKTKEVVNILKNLGINNKKIVIALGEKDDTVIKSSRNVEMVKLTAATSLNVKDIVWADAILTTLSGINVIETTYGHP